jgi:alpha-tubulin suppressor-like RCC1 family protein
MTRRFALLASLACLALFGCAQATQIVLVVDSDLTLTRVDVDVASTRSPPTRASADFSLPGTAALPLTLALYPRPGVDTEVFVTVTGQTSGSTVERRVRTRFVPGGSRMLRVILAARCVGVRCAADETCDESGCRPIEIPSGDLAAWSGGPPGHIEGAACTPSDEVCNGADDDCDMMADEDFDVATDAMNCGVCGHACTGACTSGFCAGEAIASIATGGAHSCAVSEGGALTCWGWNLEGQLGTLGVASASAPREVPGVRMGTGVAAGALHTCVTDASGRAECFGDGSSGALGRGTETDDAMPAPVLGTTTFEHVVLGPGFSCGITLAHDLVCWGANEAGQLGIGSTSPNDAPGAVTIAGAADVALGYQHACAVLDDHSLWCWGDNASGQIGPSATSSDVPVQIAGVMDAVAVAAGRAFTCFVRMAGTVSCFGSNVHGELGDGGTASSPTPRPVRDVTEATDVSAASAGTHVCVVRSTGLVNCWGANASGQLGDGTMMGGSTPVLALDLTDVVEVAAGGIADDGSGHTCARDGEGRVWCWGDAGLGQLGTSDNMQRTRPTLVLGRVAAL